MDARYVGQNFELTVPLAAASGDGAMAAPSPESSERDAPTWRGGEGAMAVPAPGPPEMGAPAGYGGEGAVAVPSPEALRARFLEVHESAYGYANPHDPIEIVNVRLTARGRLVEPPAPPAPGDPGPLPEPFERRPVWFDDGSAGETATGGAAAGAMRDAGEDAAGSTEGDAGDGVAGNTGEDARRGAGVGAAGSPGADAAAQASGGPAGSTGAGIVKDAVDCPVYDRRSLLAGHVLDGPAIIEQLDSTTPIFPGDRAVVDPAGNLAIRICGIAQVGRHHEAGRRSKGGVPGP